MSTYYIVACHDCREQSMLPKCSFPAAHERWVSWSNGVHKGHITELASEHDEYFEARIMGREVTGVGYFGLSTKKVAEPYKELPWEDD